MLQKIVLVIVFGRPVIGQGLDLGDHGRIKCFFVLHFLQQCLCLGRLLRVGGEDRAAVLRAHVVALAVQCGRIMGAEEDQQHIAQADDRGVELKLDRVATV